MNKRVWRSVLGVLAVVALLAGCEGAIEYNVERHFAPAPPTVDTGLRSLARAHSQDACAAGAVITSEDPVATYGPGSIEFVDREALDPALEAPKDDHAATSAIWARWRVDPRLATHRPDRMGVGQASCADGYLYMTLVLQGDDTDEFVPGAVQVTAGNQGSSLGGMSADANTLVIRSTATDLVPGTTGRETYLYDVSADEYTPLGALLDPGFDWSSDFAWRGQPFMSALTPDGSTLLYSYFVPGEDGDSPEYVELAALDIATGTTSVRLPDEYRGADIVATSGDGSTIAVIGGGSDGPGYYVHRATGPTRYLGNIQGNVTLSISDDGQHAAVVHPGGAEVHDLTTGTATTVAIDCLNRKPPVTFSRFGSGLSADGRYLAYQCSEDPLAVNAHQDVFVWDRTTGTSQRITPRTGGRGSIRPPTISHDGRFVAYTYERPGSIWVYGTYLWDRTTGRSTLVAPITNEPAVSGDGSVVAFTARAPDADHSDVYLWPNPAA